MIGKKKKPQEAQNAQKLCALCAFCGFFLLLAAVSWAADTDRRLIEAVKNGNRETVRVLLKQRLPVNAADSDGTTALHWAVRSNDDETVQLLLRAGANAKLADRYGITPLTLAAENGNAATIELLIKAGADPNAALPEGETPIMTAARTGKPDALKALIAHGANVNAREQRFGETALMWAAAENNAAAVKVLAEAGAELNERSTLLKFPEFKFITSGMVTTSLPRGGWTPLMYAARQGSVNAAQALADAGADMNLTDPEGSTAMVVAIINAHFDLASMLVHKGADPNVPDSTGMGALYAAVDMHTLGPMLSRPNPKVTDEFDGADLVKALLENKADPNARLKRPIIGRHHDSGDASLGEGTTPLMRAAKTVDVGVMRLLLNGGADATITQKDYSTPLMIAAAGGRGASEATTIGAIQLCLEHGIDVDAFNLNGQTAVHIAAQRGEDSVIKFLASHGAKLDQKDKQGRTPLDLASGRGGGGRGGPAVTHESTQKLLRELVK
jgi:ankyrin repeat protein